MKNIEQVIFGGGCFWCTEAVFRELRGVVSVTPGYAGGEIKNPTYEQVSGGNTMHAEVIKIEFNPKEISYTDLLTVFFATHDPTTKNRQGNDMGSEYRSLILYTNDQQKKEAESFIRELNKSFSKEGKEVVTELNPLEEFYEAEEYHKQYYERNSGSLYCQIIITPKILKLENDFENLLKSHLKTL